MSRAGPASPRRNVVAWGRLQRETRDEVAGLVASLPAALDAATPDQVKQLIAMVVDEVTTKDRVVHQIRLRPEAMPFFASPAPLPRRGDDRVAGLPLDDALAPGLDAADAV